MMDVRSHIRSRVAAAVAAEGLDAGFSAEGVVLELPREFAHGDLACPAAFGLARKARKSPAEIAAKLAGRLSPDRVIGKVEIAGGGYLNFFLGDGVWTRVLAAVESAGESYGRGTAMAGERLLVEYVSGNPTGPLVVANARHAAFGEALCRCLEAAGAKVEREYYVNDALQQVRNLALSVEAHLRNDLSLIPRDGYRGEYIKEISATASRLPDIDAILAGPEDARIERLKRHAIDQMLKSQKADLERMRVKFDSFFSEKSLHDKGEVMAAFELLKSKGVVFENEGAQWFKATDYGDEKDRVLIKSDGAPTYTLPDVAYHINKYRRGYTKLITIVGADHQTEMRTLRSALSAAGFDVSRLEVILVQFVNLKRAGEKVVMSKRAGNVVPLAELIDEVGVDAARFFFLLRAPNSHFDFDLELAKATTQDNPVYYIQYSHARLCSVMAHAREQGLPEPSAAGARLTDLADDESRQVLRKLARYPFLVEKAAAGRAPQLVAHEMLELAQSVHQFYTRWRIVGAENRELEMSRLALVAAARRVIANGLDLLGVSAPKRM